QGKRSLHSDTGQGRTLPKPLLRVEITLRGPCRRAVLSLSTNGRMRGLYPFPKDFVGGPPFGGHASHENLHIGEAVASTTPQSPECSSPAHTRARPSIRGNTYPRVIRGHLSYRKGLPKSLVIDPHGLSGSGRSSFFAIFGKAQRQSLLKLLTIDRTKPVAESTGDKSNEPLPIVLTGHTT